MNNMRLIETEKFEFEFLSKLAERESWRKEIHRPIYHMHKWWAKRLGSVFRGILLGSVLTTDKKMSESFYSINNFSDLIVFDPFMGSGTTVGEAHKLGLTALGRDINPVAVESVRVALGPMDSEKIDYEFKQLTETVGEKILELYRSTDANGLPCDVLYCFWVMQADCPACEHSIDMFSSWVIAQNAYPNRKPEIQVLCPDCGNIFPSIYGIKEVVCISCGLSFSPEVGNANGSKAKCRNCNHTFPILSAIEKSEKPKFKLYGKLVLTKDGRKEYMPVSESDRAAYEKCSQQLAKEVHNGSIVLPVSQLEDGYNTKQAMSYGFKSWKDFFNDRQLLGLGWLHKAIAGIKDQEIRDVFLVAFSGVLEFNNMFASYKGEGTGAVRHMFAHHILKPERSPIEANIWGTPKSSGSFSNLFRNRIDRAIAYRLKPTEVNGTPSAKSIVCSEPFTGRVEFGWPAKPGFSSRKIYLSCGDSSASGLPSESVDLVITDPPFFDNVHYSELADFFFAWQQLLPRGFIDKKDTTRSLNEVQDSNPVKFANKLYTVFQECYRVLKNDGLLVFTYHHSRDEGWQSIAKAILVSGFIVVNAHPVKSEMSVAVPKAQAREPIQIDTIIVCRKKSDTQKSKDSTDVALEKAREKIHRLQSSGFSLSKNDKKVVTYGQLLTTVRSVNDIALLSAVVEEEESGAIPLSLQLQYKPANL